MGLGSGGDIRDESGLFVAAHELGQRAAGLQLARNEADGRGGRWWQMLAERSAAAGGREAAGRAEQGAAGERGSQQLVWMMG
jgi:hypothetical protein